VLVIVSVGVTVAVTIEVVASLVELVVVSTELVEVPVSIMLDVAELVVAPVVDVTTLVTMLVDVIVVGVDVAVVPPYSPGGSRWKARAKLAGSPATWEPTAKPSVLEVRKSPFSPLVKVGSIDGVMGSCTHPPPV